MWLIIQQVVVVGKSRKQHKRTAKAQKSKARQESASRTEAPKGLKLWLFRSVMILFVPLFFLALELVLRVAGFGFNPSFFLEKKATGRQLLVQNDRFGWRFFGPNYARTPEAFAIDRKAPAETIRIFVMGESAAYGDPMPEFGLPRMLHAMLDLRYPATRFEVVNVAMTAINSHVIREIASDCAGADGDIWVVYMGNNEVVGPFGSGTVFGPQAPPLASIRASLALKTTRTGQLLDAIHAKMNPPKDGEETWGGMMMFLDQQVAADDPRMAPVYDHFRRNLEDIIQLGRQAGVAVAVSSVAVNLRDCAPFGSQFSPTTSASAKAQWQQHYQRGIELQLKGKWKAALEAYGSAEAIDSNYAELLFRQGQCALELNDDAAALAAFSKARDLDTLRFRFDSRMGGIVREVVAQQNDPKVLLADTEAAFAAASPHGIPGRELFYEHVHLTWEGNWLLAATLAEQLEAVLPEHVKNAPDALPSWPSSEQCAARLAWTDSDRLAGLAEVRGRLEDPPFTLQLNHGDQVSHLENLIARLEPELAQSLKQSLAVCMAAVQSAPDDVYLLRKLASLRLQSGDLDGALEAAMQVANLLPHQATAWDSVAMIYVQQNQLDEAIDYFKRGLALDPGNLWILHHLAMAHVQQGQGDKALKLWKKAVKIQPKFGTAYLGMGQVLESQGLIQAANEQYKMALQYPVNRSTDLATLGRLCIRKGWYDAALKNLQNAALLVPTNAAIRNDLATVYKAMGREQEAAEQAALALRYNPTPWIALFQQGLERGRQGKPQEAVDLFREVVRMKPDLMEGHLNLASGLLNMGMTNEAIAEFNIVVEMAPTNEQVRLYIDRLELPINTQRD